MDGDPFLSGARWAFGEAFGSLFGDVLGPELLEELAPLQVWNGTSWSPYPA